nr:MAG TPA: hypothetical protein [Caudoviricetes sp.]
MLVLYLLVYKIVCVSFEACLEKVKSLISISISFNGEIIFGERNTIFPHVLPISTFSIVILKYGLPYGPKSNQNQPSKIFHSGVLIISHHNT